MLLIDRVRPLAAALSLALAAAHGGAALAQAGPEEDSPSSDPAELRIEGRRDLEARFNSSATRVNINRSDIEAMGAISVADVLRLAPGVQVTTTANGSIEVRMRGMGTEATRILIDGVPVSISSRTAQLPLEEFPADLIERIEVIRAPSAQFQGAAGGTLNIVLRGALERREVNLRLMNQTAWGRHAPVLFASATGPLGSGAAPRDPKASSWPYLVSLNAGERNLGSDTDRRTRSSAAAPTSASIHDESRLRNRFLTLSPRLTGRLGARDRVTLRAILAGLDQDGRVASSASGLSAGTPFTTESRSPWRFGRSFQQGGVDWNRALGSGRWESTLQLERSRNDYDSDRESTTATGSAATSSASSYDEDRTETGLVARSKVDIARDGSVWSGGGELELRRLSVVSVSSLAAGGAPQQLASSSRRGALWGQYETSFDSTSVVLGLRAQDLVLTADSAGVGARYHKLGWQPSLSTRTALPDELQFRFNLARISRNPRVFEIARVAQPNLSTNSPGAPDFRGNPDLRPESTITMDTGFERRLADGGQAGINVFVRRQSDVIRRQLFLAGTRWTEQPANIGEATIVGLEGDLRGSLAWAGLPRDWRLAAHATLFESRLSGGASSGERLPGQPRYLANVGISKPQRPAGGWFGGGTLTLTGPADLNTANAAALTTGRERSHAQLDLFIGDTIPRVGFWRFGVNNLTNYRLDRSRVVAETASGVVHGDESVRRLTPRWTLTLGTRL